MDERGWKWTRITLKAAEMLAFCDSQWMGEDMVLAETESAKIIRLFRCLTCKSCSNALYYKDFELGCLM